MTNRIILALCLLGHLVDLSQAETVEDARKRVEEALPRLLERGFKRATDILQQENAVAVGRNPNNQNIARKLSRNRKASRRSKISSTCRGRGLLETSKMIVKELDIDESIVAEVLNSISITPSDLPSVDNIPVCRDLKVTTRNCDPQHPYRLINGDCNNIDTGNGASGLPFSRILSAVYQDNVDKIRKAKSGADLPNPRVLSYTISQINFPNTESLKITQMVKAWGQFLDNDITLTPETAAQPDPNGPSQPIPCCDDGTPTPSINTTEDCLQISVSGDSFFSSYGVLCLRFVRSLSAPSVGGVALGARNQINQVTSFIDASQVYGSDSETEQELRDTIGGRMRVNEVSEEPSCSTSSRCLPFLPESSPRTDDNYFNGGDVRVNEQPGLTSMHTAFLRFHNIIADKFLTINNSLSHEFVYQESRRIVYAVMQQITYDEFLPIVLGLGAMRSYSLELASKKRGFKGYDKSIDPSIFNAFATAAFRFGHSLIGNILKGAGSKSPLVNTFFNNKFIKENSSMYPTNVLLGECQLPSQIMDAKLIEDMVNRLFADGPNFLYGSDLVVLNIMRGRDHGLQGYNDWRAFCGLGKYSSFTDMKTGLPSDVVVAFENHYGHVDDVDLFLAGIAENPVPGALIGPTFVCLLAKQFNVLKFGDRFWFENHHQPKSFSHDQVKAIRDTTLATVLCETTTIESIQLKPMKVIDNTNVLTLCSVLKKRSVLKNLRPFLGSPPTGHHHHRRHRRP